MSTSIRVPFFNRAIAVKFPSKCVYCGLKTELTSPVKVIRVEQNTTDGRTYTTTTTRTYSIDLSVPYCETHIATMRRNNNVLTTISGIGMLIGGGSVIGFALQNSTNLKLEGNFVEVIGSLIIAFVVIMFFAGLTAILFTLAAKILFFPFNKTLIHQTGIGNLFSGGELGIKITFTEQKDALDFKFTNARVAREFAQLNNQPAKGRSTFIDNLPCVFGHDFSRQIYTTQGNNCVLSTCCSRCGTERDAKIIEHNFGDWRYVSATSCKQQRICAQCGSQQERIVHTFDSTHPDFSAETVQSGIFFIGCDKYSKCLRCDEKKLITSMHDYEFRDDLKQSPCQLYKKCKKCGDVVDNEFAHNYKAIKTREHEVGRSYTIYTEFACAVCGDTKEEVTDGGYSDW